MITEPDRRAPRKAIWVVEWFDDGRHLYVTDFGLNGRSWTSEFADACDFGSRKNAEQHHELWVKHNFPGSRVADHEWMIP